MPHADGLYYEGHGAGDPLLLITGWTISAAVFEPVLDLYAEHFECIVYDHRGSARSGGSPPPTMGGLADSTARLLTELRIPRAIVYGLSMRRARGRARDGPRLCPRSTAGIARAAARMGRAPVVSPRPERGSTGGARPMRGASSASTSAPSC